MVKLHGTNGECSSHPFGLLGSTPALPDSLPKPPPSKPLCLQRPALVAEEQIDLPKWAISALLSAFLHCPYEKSPPSNLRKQIILSDVLRGLGISLRLSSTVAPHDAPRTGHSNKQTCLLNRQTVFDVGSMNVKSDFRTNIVIFWFIKPTLFTFIKPTCFFSWQCFWIDISWYIFTHHWLGSLPPWVAVVFCDQELKHPSYRMAVSVR